MERHALTERQWQRIQFLLPPNGRRGQQWKDHRQHARTKRERATSIDEPIAAVMPSSAALAGSRSPGGWRHGMKSWRLTMLR